MKWKTYETAVLQILLRKASY